MGKNYKDEVWYDIVPMDVCCRPWLYDRMVLYNGFKHTYSFVINEKKYYFGSFKTCFGSQPFKREGETLFTHGECQQKLKVSKVEFVLLKDDEIKEKPNLDLGVDLFSQPERLT